jgi:hypothetical protein
MSSGKTDAMLDNQNSQIALKYDHELKAHEQLWGMKVLRHTEGDKKGEILDPDNPTFEQQWVTDETTGEVKKAGVNWDAFDHQLKAYNAQVANELAGREHQDAVATQQWELGVDQQAFSWDQQDAAYKQNQSIVKEQLAINDAEYNFAAAEETALLEEQLIEGAYTNLELNNQFFEAVGAKGFEDIALKHGLQKTESDIEYKGDKIADNTTHQVGQLDIKESKTKLSNIGKKAEHAFAEGQIVGSLKDSQVANQYKLASLAVQRDMGKQQSDYQQMKIRRNEDSVRAKSAHESQERVIQSLKAQGKASLSQAGRSKGKAQQAVIAELGRYNTYVANTMIRGEAAAKAEIAMSRRQQINNVHKAHLAEMKINEDNISAVSSAKRSIAKANSTLAIGQQQDQLDVDSIQNEIDNLILSSNVDIDHLESTFNHAQGQAGLALNKNDWDISNIERDFALSQDQLSTSLEQAVEASMRNQEGLVLDKDQADAKANAMAMLDPNMIADEKTGETWRDILSLENYEPKDLPVPQSIAPLPPTAPPDPREGAMVDSSLGMGHAAMGLAGATTAGVGTMATLAAMAPEAGWASLGAGAGTFAAVAPWAVAAFMAYNALF